MLQKRVEHIKKNMSSDNEKIAEDPWLDDDLEDEEDEVEGNDEEEAEEEGDDEDDEGSDDINVSLPRKRASEDSSLSSSLELSSDDEPLSKKAKGMAIDLSPLENEDELDDLDELVLYMEDNDEVDAIDLELDEGGEFDLSL